MGFMGNGMVPGLGRIRISLILTFPPRIERRYWTGRVRGATPFVGPGTLEVGEGEEGWCARRWRTSAKGATKLSSWERTRCRNMMIMIMMMATDDQISPFPLVLLLAVYIL